MLRRRPVLRVDMNSYGMMQPFESFDMNKVLHRIIVKSNACTETKI